MIKSKKKIIDPYFEKIKAVKNVSRICISTYDGFLLKSYQLSENQEEDLPAVLSKYFDEIKKLTSLSAESEFTTGYHLNKEGFMVISDLGDEAVLLVIAKGRENTGKVLRLAQQFVKEYNSF